ncbi:MAG TPA: cupin domain-containing protein [Burkholderiales bacterium]|nr:cupin domain-containing protein [Burkholderiales bacterium]
MPEAHQPGESEFRVIWPDTLEWQPFAGFPSAVRLAILVGDPTQAGPYVIRVRVPAGERMMPHRYSDDRIYTVISGILYIGLGEHFDESKLTAHAPGSLLVLPSGQAHFHWARSGEFIAQVNGIGAVALDYLKRGDDPRQL